MSNRVKILLLVLLMVTVGAITCKHYGMVPKDFQKNLAYRKEILRLCGNDALAAAQIKAMCAEDILFYINSFGWTYDPRQPVRKMPFITYPEFQDEAIVNICDAIYSGEDVVIPKSRCMGASWMGLVCFEWLWHFQPDSSFLVISRNEKYVDESGNPKTLFWKIDFLHENQPRWLLPTGRWLGGKDPNRRLLHLGNADNGSVIDGESTTGDAGRGDRRTAMFIDEHAAFDTNDGFRVLRATRDTTNCRIFNSTPQGSGNAFYEVVHNTAARKIRMHWSDHPVYSQGLYTAIGGVVKQLKSFAGDSVRVYRKGWKQPKMLRYPDSYPFIADGKVRSPWYDNQCARCVSDMEIAQELDIDFVGSDYQFFDPVSVNELILQNCKDPFALGNVDYDRETLIPAGFVAGGGNLSLWLNPDRNGQVSTGRKFVLGADVSAGTGASNSVASVVDIATGEKIAVWRSAKTRPIDFADVCIVLARYFGNAWLIWDASGPTGQTFTNRVIEKRYPYLYYRNAESCVTRKVSDQPGYFLNPDAKATLLEEYRKALADRTFINFSREGMLECLQFIVQPGGKVEHSGAVNAQDPSGARTAHGDETIADALACKCMLERFRLTTAARPDIPVGSLAWRMKQKEQERKVCVSELKGGW